VTGGLPRTPRRMLYNHLLSAAARISTMGDVSLPSSVAGASFLDEPQLGTTRTTRCTSRRPAEAFVRERPAYLPDVAVSSGPPQTRGRALIRESWGWKFA